MPLSQTLSRVNVFYPSRKSTIVCFLLAKAQGQRQEGKHKNYYTTFSRQHFTTPCWIIKVETQKNEI